MNIAIRYFTKSGNTEKLAKAISEEVGVPSEKITTPLSDRVDILFLGCSYYAFDMDPEVKKFLEENKDKISKIACFGTSAMMKSMCKPLEKETDIDIADEFHCRGSFGPMHKGRPDENDLKNVKEFARKVIG